MGLELLNQTMDQAGTGLSAEEVAVLAGQIQDLKILLDNPPNGMSNWDYEFIESVSIAYEELKVLSKNRIENIERLYMRHCS
jgi:hypothetical protein